MEQLEFAQLLEAAGFEEIYLRFRAHNSEEIWTRENVIRSFLKHCLTINYFQVELGIKVRNWARCYYGYKASAVAFTGAPLSDENHTTENTPESSAEAWWRNSYL